MTSLLVLLEIASILEYIFFKCIQSLFVFVFIWRNYSPLKRKHRKLVCSSEFLSQPYANSFDMLSDFLGNASSFYYTTYIPGNVIISVYLDFVSTHCCVELLQQSEVYEDRCKIHAIKFSHLSARVLVRQLTLRCSRRSFSAPPLSFDNFLRLYLRRF